MKFTVDNRNYIVKWEYPDIKDFYPRTTICKIYNNETSYEKPLVETIATCGRKEVFNKNIGRKISLDKALHRLFPYTIVMHGDLFPKQVRAIAWQEYFKESPKRLKNA